MPDDELEAIRAALETERSVDRVHAVDLVADEGTVCATVEKKPYVRRKNA